MSNHLNICKGFHFPLTTMSWKETIIFSCLWARARVNMPHRIQGIVAKLVLYSGLSPKKPKGIVTPSNWWGQRLCLSGAACWELQFSYENPGSPLHLHCQKPTLKRNHSSHESLEEDRASAIAVPGTAGMYSSLQLVPSFLSLKNLLIFRLLTPGAQETTTPSSLMAETSSVRPTALGTFGNYSLAKNRSHLIWATWLSWFPFPR